MRYYAGLCGILVSVNPAVDVIDVVLFAPQHSSQRLAHYVRLVRRELLWNHRSVEHVGFLPAPFDDFVERLAVEAVGLERCRLAAGKQEADRRTALRRNGQEVVRCGLGSLARRTYSRHLLMNDVVVD